MYPYACVPLPMRGRHDGQRKVKELFARLPKGRYVARGFARQYPTHSAARRGRLLQLADADHRACDGIVRSRSRRDDKFAPFLYPRRMSDALKSEAARRRTFAIISHPDAGKTTLTEHLLLLGGAIHAAGRVKARGEARRAKSDWMKIEQERGISVTSAVMTFEYRDAVFNLLDTPGHEDFSEDTYRT